MNSLRTVRTYVITESPKRGVNVYGNGGRNFRPGTKSALSREVFAEKVFVTRQAVSHRETGKATPDTSIILELCEVLGIGVNELLCGDIKPEISAGAYKCKSCGHELVPAYK